MQIDSEECECQAKTLSSGVASHNWTSNPGWGFSQWKIMDIDGGFSSVTLSGSWKDQGWGNRYGQLNIRLMKRDGTSPCSFSSGLGMAPHAETSFNKTFTADNTPCLKQAARGDMLDLMVRPGKSSSGFKLYLNDVKMVEQCDTCSQKVLAENVGSLSFTNYQGWGAVAEKTVTLNGPVVSVKMTGSWHDQGWGNR